MSALQARRRGPENPDSPEALVANREMAAQRPFVEVRNQHVGKRFQRVEPFLSDLLSVLLDPDETIIDRDKVTIGFSVIPTHLNAIANTFRLFHLPASINIRFTEQMFYVASEIK